MQLECQSENIENIRVYLIKNKNRTRNSSTVCVCVFVARTYRFQFDTVHVPQVINVASCLAIVTLSCVL